VNNVLGKILGPGRDEVTGEWRRLHNEELYDVYFSPNIVWVIKSRIMGWMGYVAWGTGEVHTGCCCCCCVYATNWMVQGLSPGRKKRVFSSPKHPNYLWDLLNPKFNGYWGFFVRGKVAM